MTGRGRLFGLTGWGGDQGGSGVIGAAGGVVPVGIAVGSVTGQNAGVYGTGAVDAFSTSAVGVIGQGGPTSAGGGPAVGVLGEGGSESPGVVGREIIPLDQPGLDDVNPAVAEPGRAFEGERDRAAAAGREQFHLPPRRQVPRERPARRGSTFWLARFYSRGVSS